VVNFSDKPSLRFGVKVIGMVIDPIAGCEVSFLIDICKLVVGDIAFANLNCFRFDWL
jgi:hypothetical protein